MTSKPETVIKQIEVLENKTHSEIFMDFYIWLTEEQDSSTRNASTYLKILRMFSMHVGQKPINSISKEDVISFLDKRKKSVEDDPEKKWERTWNDYLARLIGFYKWLSNKDGDDDREDWETPEPIKSIKKKKNKRDSSYSPNDVWSQDELLLVVKYIDNIRDKVIFTVSWDLASRSDEIVKVRIRDIVIKEKYAEISTAWNTKTGTRTNPVIVGFPYLRELLNSHPFASDPNAFLFLSKTSLKPINPDSLWRVADTLKKRLSKMIKENEIKGDDRQKLIKVLQKPWNPYLIGRHSSITEKTDMLNDFQLKQFSGWSINSKRSVTYVHRKGKQVIGPLLQEYGIIEKKEHKSIRQECSKCGHINTTEATLCSNCSFVLNNRAWEQTKLEEAQEKKDLTLTISALKQKIETLEKQQSEGQSPKERDEQNKKIEDMELDILQLQSEVGVLRKNKKSDDKVIRTANTILYKNQEKIPELQMKPADPKYFVKDKTIEKNYSRIYDIDLNAFHVKKKSE